MPRWRLWSLLTDLLRGALSDALLSFQYRKTEAESLSFFHFLLASPLGRSSYSAWRVLAGTSRQRTDSSSTVYFC
ncbi:hypothetical protein QBC32DRAFT_346096 [Pseudoneurospora amorphoporcata]|uniref:Secreted protein n=1 Tax=Pseudoneurospora amorphoporcata TaxID=241081 RepID=A0AAN6NT04_9PEZI|nr:hypothetical protein QBC32DRAFT_346096 [Pseudoneurospora amorphoporcata]